MGRAGAAPSARCQDALGSWERADPQENLAQTPLPRPKIRIWMKAALWSPQPCSWGVQPPMGANPQLNPLLRRDRGKAPTAVGETGSGPGAGIQLRDTRAAGLLPVAA